MSGLGSSKGWRNLLIILTEYKKKKKEFSVPELFIMLPLELNDKTTRMWVHYLYKAGAIKKLGFVNGCRMMKVLLIPNESVTQVMTRAYHGPPYTGMDFFMMRRNNL